MRDVAIYTNPIMEPGVCARCGSQDKDWFVDLGLNVTGNKKHELNDLTDQEYKYPDHWFDGAIIYCCDCITNLFTDVSRRFIQYKEDHEVKVEFNGPGRSNPDPDNGNPKSDSDDSSSEQSTGKIVVNFSEPIAS